METPASKFARERNFRKFQLTGMKKQLFKASQDNSTVTEKESETLIIITKLMQSMLNNWEDSTKELK